MTGRLIVFAVVMLSVLISAASAYHAGRLHERNAPTRSFWDLLRMR